MTRISSIEEWEAYTDSLNGRRKARKVSPSVWKQFAGILVGVAGVAGFVIVSLTLAAWVMASWLL